MSNANDPEGSNHKLRSIFGDAVAGWRRTRGCASHEELLAFRQRVLSRRRSLSVWWHVYVRRCALCAADLGFSARPSTVRDLLLFMKVDAGFFHSKSVLAVGVVAAMTFLIAAALHVEFGYEQKVVATIISLVCGAYIAFKAHKSKPVLRIAFWLFTSLWIFAAAAGISALATAAAPSELPKNPFPASGPGEGVPQIERKWLDPWFPKRDQIIREIVQRADYFASTWKQRDAEEARWLLELGLRLTTYPKDVASLEYRLGTVKFRDLGDPPDKNKLMEILGHYENGIKANPKNPSLHLGRADVYRKLEEWQNAIISAKRALELSKNDDETRDSATFCLGQAYRGNRELDLARQCFNEAVKSKYVRIQNRATKELAALSQTK